MIRTHILLSPIIKSIQTLPQRMVKFLKASDFHISQFKTWGICNQHFPARLWFFILAALAAIIPFIESSITRH